MKILLTITMTLGIFVMLGASQNAEAARFSFYLGGPTYVAPQPYYVAPQYYVAPRAHYYVAPRPYYVPPQPQCYQVYDPYDGYYYTECY